MGTSAFAQAPLLVDERHVPFPRGEHRNARHRGRWFLGGTFHVHPRHHPSDSEPAARNQLVSGSVLYRLKVSPPLMTNCDAAVYPPWR